MTMTTAAFYIPNDNIVAKKVNEEASEKSRGMLLSALKNQHTEIQNFDLKKMCDNLTLQGKVEFVQRYATGALTKIINGEPITNKTMLDSLFNTYAPAINASLAKSGYNSVMAMKDAAAHGTINASSFLGAFNSGLIAVDETSKSNTLFEKYGEEIPIDVVEKCYFKYETLAAQQKTEQNNESLYIDNLKPVEIVLTAHVKNKNAELWNINDYSFKLASMMSTKEAVVLRIGKDVFEDAILKIYEPEIINANDIKFIANISYQYKILKDNSNYNTDNSLIRKCIDNNVKNTVCNTEYIGISSIEKVVPTDSIIASEIKKVVGNNTNFMNIEM